MNGRIFNFVHPLGIEPRTLGLRGPCTTSYATNPLGSGAGGSRTLNLMVKSHLRCHCATTPKSGSLFEPHRVLSPGGGIRTPNARRRRVYSAVSNRCSTPGHSRCVSGLPGRPSFLLEVGWSPYVPTSGLAIRLEVGSANPA